jgi:hypothetical protein
MPLWMLLLVCIGLAVSMCRLVLGMMLGRRAAGAAVGHLAAMAIWSLVTAPIPNSPSNPRRDNTHP